MGTCCKERANSNELALYDDAPIVNKVFEEKERKFTKMLKRIQISNPFMRVLEHSKW